MSDRVERLEAGISRRALLAAVSVAGSATFSGCTTERRVEGGANPVTRTPQKSHSSPDLERWVDEVPRPGVIESSGTKDGRPRYEVPIREFEQKVYRDLPPTTLWGTTASSPVRRSRPSRVSRSTSSGRTNCPTTTSCRRIRRSTVTSSRTTGRASVPSRTSTEGTWKPRVTATPRRGSPGASRRLAPRSRSEITTT
jgi:hypothetical protein